MGNAERSNVIHVDFSGGGGPRMEGQSTERAPSPSPESGRHLSLVPNHETSTHAASTAHEREGSHGVSFQAGSTKIDARSGKGTIFKGISQDNTSDAVWDKNQKFAGRKFATPADLAELMTEPIGLPKSRLAA